MIAWLRRWLCRCPEPEGYLQNTSYTGGFVSEGPFMQVHVGGSTDAGPPLYDELAAAERRRHLHAVPDEPA